MKDVPEIKLGSLVKLKKPVPENWGIPSWVNGHMIYDILENPHRSAKCNRPGDHVCFKPDKSDYWYLLENNLEVIQGPVTQMSLFEEE
jgi:hypothetical protein